MDHARVPVRLFVGVAAVGILGGCTQGFWDRSPRVGGSRVEPPGYSAQPAPSLAPPVWMEAPRSAPAPETWTPVPGVTSGEERHLLSEVNRIRAQRGLKPLRYNPLLHAAAERHSQEQYRYGYMGHGSPDPSRDTLGQRMDQAGYRGQIVSEVVAWGYRDPASVLEGWMNSRDHRDVLLDPDISEGAFSRVADYWTGNFGAPRWSPGPEDYDPRPAPVWRAPQYDPPAPRPAYAPAPRAAAPTRPPFVFDQAPAAPRPRAAPAPAEPAPAWTPPPATPPPAVRVQPPPARKPPPPSGGG